MLHTSLWTNFINGNKTCYVRDAGLLQRTTMLIFEKQRFKFNVVLYIKIEKNQEKSNVIWTVTHYVIRTIQLVVWLRNINNFLEVNNLL